MVESTKSSVNSWKAIARIYNVMDSPRKIYRCFSFVGGIGIPPTKEKSVNTTQLNSFNNIVVDIYQLKS